MSDPIHTDIAIVGGGICGLWILNVLRSRGYRALLLEKNALGQGQTIASQGMIHGGIKYTLEGFATESFDTIADMPALWRGCLAGEGPVDLTRVDLLSDDYYLFSDGRLTSRLATFFGSKSLRGRIAPVKRQDYPPAFADKGFRGSLYQLQDMVIDTASLLAALRDNQAAYIFRTDVDLVTDDGEPYLVLDDDQRLAARRYILAAGAGNEGILSGSGMGGVSMQRRPLHQVIVKSPKLPSVYAHAISLESGAKPRVTITTHPAADGDNVWYLGGGLAESGVTRASDDQIAVAARELESLFPWIDLADGQWATLRIDRAEPAQPEQTRPEHPFAKAIDDKVVVCWPTKLTLAPMLTAQLLPLLGDAVDPGEEILPDLPSPKVARAPWEDVF